MSLVKQNSSFWPDLSDFFEHGSGLSRFKTDWSPAINVIDNEDSYEIEVAAPGLKKEDFNVSVENQVMTISGKTEKEEEEKKKNFTRKEFSSRSFVKRFSLPENVEGENIQASHKDGILHLVLKKSDKSQSNRKEVSIN